MYEGVSTIKFIQYLKFVVLFYKTVVINLLLSAAVSITNAISVGKKISELIQLKFKNDGLLISLNKKVSIARIFLTEL